MSWQDKSISFIHKTVITLLVLTFIFLSLMLAAMVTSLN